MTVFESYEFDGSVEDLDKESLVDTLTDFMEKHEQNAAAFQELQESLEDTESEYDALQDQVTSFKEGLAKEAAEGTPLTEDELVKFDLDRLAEIASDTKEAPVGDGNGDGLDTQDEPEEEPRFSEPNPPKVGDISEEDSDEESKEFARKSLGNFF